MIECYFSSCPNHSKREPFCNLNSCKASPKEIDDYTIIREEWLLAIRAQFKEGAYTDE